MKLFVYYRSIKKSVEIQNISDTKAGFPLANFAREANSFAHACACVFINVVSRSISPTVHCGEKRSSNDSYSFALFPSEKCRDLNRF